MSRARSLTNSRNECASSNWRCTRTNPADLLGRHAAKQREKLGGEAGILGFTHFCTRSAKWGSFVIGRKTIKKRMRAGLLVIKIELGKTMHDLAKTGA
jgi:hypothetical protein